MQPLTLDTTRRETVIECLREFSDKAAEIEITDNCDLEFDLGFDSFAGIELACEFMSRLGVSIPQNANPLTCRDQVTGIKRFRTFGELAEYIAQLPRIQ